MKGGIIGLLVGKAWSLVVGLILVFALLTAVMGQSAAASLASSAATVGGTATGLVFGGMPSFFTSIKTGQGLVKDATPAVGTDGAAGGDDSGDNAKGGR